MDRREFLTNTAAVASGVMLLSSTAKASELIKTPNNDIKNNQQIKVVTETDFEFEGHKCTLFTCSAIISNFKFIINQIEEVRTVFYNYATFDIRDSNLSIEDCIRKLIKSYENCGKTAHILYCCISPNKENRGEIYIGHTNHQYDQDYDNCLHNINNEKPHIHIVKNCHSQLNKVSIFACKNKLKMFTDDKDPCREAYLKKNNHKADDMRKFFESQKIV